MPSGRSARVLKEGRTCDLCRNKNSKGLKCDNCNKLWCQSCINNDCDGSLPGPLVDFLAESGFQATWDCARCSDQSLPQQLISQKLFTDRELRAWGCTIGAVSGGEGLNRDEQLPQEVLPETLGVGLQSDPGDNFQADLGVNPRGASTPGSPVGGQHPALQASPIQPRPTSSSGPSGGVNDGGPFAAAMQMMLTMMDRMEGNRREDLARMEAQRREDMEQHRQDMRVLLNHFGRPSQAPAVPATPALVQANPTAAPARVSLPKLQLPTFSGNSLDWLNFWESFELNVHNQTGLEDKQKLDYLYQLLKGNAFNKVKGLGLQGTSYQAAVDVLKQEYGRPQDLIEARLKLLQDLPLVRDSHGTLENFIDEVRTTTVFLQRMGVPETVLDFQVYALTHKLPGSVVGELKRMRVLRGTSNQNWTINEFIQLLSDVKAMSPQVFANRSKFVEENRSKNGSGQPYSKPTASFLQSNDKSAKSSVLPCIFCSKSGHFSDDCKSVSSVNSRKDIVQKQRRCFNCLSTGHMAKACVRTRKCFHCKLLGHHSSLCSRKQDCGQTSQQMTASMDQHGHQDFVVPTYLAGADEVDGIIMATCNTAISNAVTLQTKRMNIYLDAGARHTCISKEAAQALGLESRSQVLLKTARFNTSNIENVKADIVAFVVHGVNGFRLPVTAYSVPNMAPPLPLYSVQLNATTWKAIRPYDPKNAPPNTTQEIKIDVLLGMDYWNSLMGPGVCASMALEGRLALYHTPIGSILAGNTLKEKTETATVTTTFCCDTKRNITELWSLDTLGIKEDSTDLSKKAEMLQKFKESTQFENGRYYVRWPWKSDSPQIASNFGSAKYRLNRTLDTLCSNPDQLGNFNDYNAIIMDQLKKGIIEPVSWGKADGPVVHYISHFPHIRADRATTKVRIVYDASAKTKPHNVSLNDLIYTGINYLEDIVGLLLRFRLCPIAITSDIEKAFLQVGLQSVDRDSTRFLWLKDTSLITTENNIQHFRFTRIPFGVGASPYLLGATINHHLDINPCDVAARIRGNIYMDNMFFGVQDFEEGARVYKESKKLMSNASMNLREWISNDQRFNESLPDCDKVKDRVTKVLGILWDTVDDQFRIRFNPDSMDIATKRTALHMVAKAFDPMGLINPLTIRGKIQLQKLWLDAFDWDDVLPDSYQAEWKDIIKNIKKGSGIPFFRRIFDASADAPIRLACFTDASQSAYAAVIYLVQGNRSNVVFSKARVAPVKASPTLPRLELLGVLIGARALRFVTNQLRRPIAAQFLWTDSEIALHWLHSSKPLEPYVRRRVDEIKAQDIKFGYVPSSENPADIASRGTTYAKLVESSWFSGPNWLLQDVGLWRQWTKGAKPPSLHKVVVPKKAGTSNHAVCVEEFKNPFDINLSRFSTLQRLLRVTAYCGRFISALQRRKCSNTQLEAIDIESARLAWLTSVQAQACHDTIAALKLGGHTRLSRQLDLFWDSGLLRCGGRIANAKISRDSKFPILLPKSHGFTTLVIEAAHKKVLHFGSRCTLAEIRQLYWIPHGLSQVKKVLRKCLVCTKAEGGPLRPPRMGQLPSERLTKAPAFTYTGLDYVGPLTVKPAMKGAEYQKRWIALFTCFSTRAIHLELVKDSSADSAFNALRRFMSRRGTPVMILTDNAPQFSKTSNILKTIWQEKGDKDLYARLVLFFADREVRWRTIPEGSPWFGGFYERLVGLVKRAIRKVLWRASVDDDHLMTLIVDIEGILNTRPLLSLKTDIKDSGILTPADFIAPVSALNLPPSDKAANDPEYVPQNSARKNLLKGWTRSQRYLDNFWKIWQSQYLQELRATQAIMFKSKRSEVRREPKEGEVVLVKGVTPRATWKLARIIRLLRSTDDGMVRYVEVRFPSGSFSRRGVRDLVPLEADVEDATGDLLSLFVISGPGGC